MKIVYALVDPSTNELKYIGETIDPVMRLMGHLGNRAGSTPVARWVQGLRDQGTKPVLIELETVPRSESRIAELFWIEYYSKMLGANLLNLLGNGYVVEKGRRKAITAELRAIYVAGRILVRPLKLLRENSGLSRYEIAAQVKSTTCWVKACERGDIHISLYRAYLLAKTLGCTVEQLRMTREMREATL